MLVQIYFNGVTREVAKWHDCCGETEPVCLGLQPSCFIEAVIDLYADLNMDGLFDWDGTEIGAQIINVIVLLNGSRIAKEADDPTLGEPSVSAFVQVPQVVMGIDDVG